MRKLMENLYPLEPAEQHLGDASSDSDDSAINPRTVNILLNALRAPVGGTNKDDLIKLLNDNKGLNEHLSSNCFTQCQFISTDDDKENHVNQDTNLKSAYNRLLLENQRLLRGMAELVAVNENVKKEKIYISMSLRNLQQQLKLYVNSNTALVAKENGNNNKEINVAYKKLKAESEQRINFCNKKLEEYIIKLHDQESTIEDLKQQLKLTKHTHEAEIADLKRKLAYRVLNTEFMSKSEGCVFPEPSFTNNRLFKSQGKPQRGSEPFSAEKFIFGDQSSISNLFMDYEVDARLDVLKTCSNDRDANRNVAQ